jgi:pimeloyl-ACP methyl ester carboxylesterase
VPLHSRFATKEFIGKVTCKIVIFQGTDDWVVSLKSAERLKPFLKETDEFVIIPGGEHNNLSEYVLFHTKLAGVLQ